MNRTLYETCSVGLKAPTATTSLSIEGCNRFVFDMLRVRRREMLQYISARMKSSSRPHCITIDNGWRQFTLKPQLVSKCSPWQRDAASYHYELDNTYAFPGPADLDGGGFGGKVGDPSGDLEVALR